MPDANDAYTAAYDAADKEFHDVLAERDKLDKRLLALKQTKATLMRLMGHLRPGAVANQGITEAVREYLQWAAVHQPKAASSIREIRDQLESVGFDFSSYKNPNASLNGTLERLREGGEVARKRTRRDDGVTVTGYRWIGAVNPEIVEAVQKIAEAKKEES